MDKRAIAVKIRELRKATGLSQEEVAARAKIAHRAVQRVETGEANPTLDTLFAIGKVLGFDPSLNIGGKAAGEINPSLNISAALSLGSAILGKLSTAKPALREALLAAIFADVSKIEHDQAVTKAVRALLKIVS